MVASTSKTPRVTQVARIAVATVVLAAVAVELDVLAVFLVIRGL